MRISSPILAGLAAASLASACGGGPRAAVVRAVEARDLERSLDEYDRFREDEGGGDADLLGHVAAMVLEEAARGDDAEQRDAALSQLATAGTEAEDVLEDLAEGADDPVVRARALGVLARRGDSGARSRLRAMAGSDDARVLAEAVRFLDPDDERDSLLSLLEHATGDVRAAAAKALEGAAPSGTVRASLSEAARVDPLPKVRAAAVRALGAYGPRAVEPLRGRLSDESASVRMAAVGALVRADRHQALVVIGSLLEMTPTRAGVEAARVLATSGGEGSTGAQAFMLRALHDAEGPVRTQAAVALSSLPADPALDEALAAALADEADPQVKVSLASTLIDREATEDEARESLEAILADEDPGQAMVRVQAAAILAEAGGSDEALSTLSHFMREGDPTVRRTAARAMARDAMKPDRARVALRDEDALVRIYAAGGILAALSARG